MTIDNFKQEIDKLFPCRWKEIFFEDIRETFNRYTNIVSKIDKIEQDTLDKVSNLCNRILKVIELDYNGQKGNAITEFHTIMNGDARTNGLFASIGSVNINPQEYYFRARKREIGVDFSIQDMFHIPLNKRGIASTQRYSFPGFPCLYLGNSVYSCWEELRRPSFDNLMFSAYKVKYAFKVFDMRIPNDSDYKEEAIARTIERIPLILACSFVVKNPSDFFKPEYTISQMLIETIIDNNRKITEHEKSPIDEDVIWGVIYTSTHISNDIPYGKQFLENIVLPVIESNKSTYCYCLASLFDISRPLCYENKSLKEDTTNVLEEFIDQEKYKKEILRESYKQSQMGYFENKLKNTKFETLPHLVIGSPTAGITLNNEESAINIPVRSSGSFTVEINS